MTAHPAGHAANSRTRTILGYGAFIGFAAGGGILGWFVRTQSGLLVGVVIGLMVAVAVWTLLHPAAEQGVDSMIEAKPASEDSGSDFALPHVSAADQNHRGASVAHASRSARTHRTGDL